jgi:hypothetical protein
MASQHPNPLRTQAKEPQSRGEPCQHARDDHRGAPERRRSKDTAMMPPMVMMAVEHYRPYRWVQVAIAGLSLWLITSPFTFGYTSHALRWSDVLSGICALVLSLFALKPRYGLASWLNLFVGIWLLLAPLVFWSPDPAAFANDTLVGALLIGFGFIIPMSMQMQGPTIPEGWSYNPSAWSQRAPVIALSVLSFFAARYMAAFQLGYIHSAWDPFFAASTERVLTSRVSRAWPVSDAGLGAVTYLIEVLMGLMGDQRRWRTMPWMVAGFGVVVIPLGIVSITLVILQPIAVGAWCSLCLFTAAAMLVMIPLSLDEVVAMLQFVAQKKRAGHSAWRVFWLGGELAEDAPVWQPTRPDTWAPRAMFWGLTGSWNLWLSIALGIWLMFAPAVLGVGIGAAAAHSNHLVGALIVVIAVTALAEVVRPARFLNSVLGLWLLVGPWFLAGGPDSSRWNSAICGALVLLFSVPVGRIRDHYGAFDDVARWAPFGIPRAKNRPQLGPRPEAPAR